jgi:hypothetical protein
MRTFSTSPVLRAVVRHRLLLAPVFMWAMIPLAAGSSPWLLLVFALFLGIELWLWLGPHGRRPFLAAVRRLHTDLRWFGADLLTWHRPAQTAELQAALADKGFAVHDLGEGPMRSGADLARAVEGAFGALAFPRDPIEKVVTILARLGQKGGAPHAVLLRNADALAAADPAALARFCTLWSEIMHAHSAPVLVFCEAKNVDLAAAAVPPQLPQRSAGDRSAAGRAARDDQNAEDRPAGRAPTADAPPASSRGFWWERKAGELLR